MGPRPDDEQLVVVATAGRQRLVRVTGYGIGPSGKVIVWGADQHGRPFSQLAEDVTLEVY